MAEESLSSQVHFRFEHGTTAVDIGGIRRWSCCRPAVVSRGGLAWPIGSVSEVAMAIGRSFGGQKLG